jgi:hypothetical protein
MFSKSVICDLFQAHAFYFLRANYAGVTYPTLSSFYNFPQSYYVPHRICQSYKARLEANGLWAIPAAGEESEGEKPRRFGERVTEKEDPKQTFKSAFQRERVSYWSGCSSTVGLNRSLSKTGLRKGTCGIRPLREAVGRQGFFLLR